MLPARRPPAGRHPDLPGHPWPGRRRSTSGRSRCRAGWSSPGSRPTWGGGIAFHDPARRGRGAQHAPTCCRRATFSDVLEQEMWREPGVDHDLTEVLGERSARCSGRALRDAPPRRRARRPPVRDVQRRPTRRRSSRASPRRRTSPRWRAACAAATGSPTTRSSTTCSEPPGSALDRATAARDRDRCRAAGRCVTVRLPGRVAAMSHLDHPGQCTSATPGAPTTRARGSRPGAATPTAARRRRGRRGRASGRAGGRAARAGRRPRPRR